jgi:hypothetical protein
MDPHSPIRRDLIEQLDACRRGSNDLAESEMAELAERVRNDSVLARTLRSVQDVDDQIATAMAQVSVPPGLIARLLAAVGEDGSGRSEPAAPVVVAIPEEVALDSEVGADRSELPLDRAAASESRPWTRRRAAFTAVVMGLIAASIVAAVFYWGAPAEDVMNVETLQQLARDFYSQEKLVHPPGNPVVIGGHPLGQFPLPNEIVWSTQSTHWRAVSGFLGSSAGVAYDLTPPGAARATLYVVRPAAEAASVLTQLAAYPSTPATTAGLATATWYDPNQKLLYVLVVDGGEQEFRQFVRPTQLAGIRLRSFAVLRARAAA